MRTFATSLLVVATLGVNVTRKTLQFESSYAPRTYTPKISLDLPQFEAEATDSDDGEITFKRCQDGKIARFCRDDIEVEFDREDDGSDYHRIIPGDVTYPVPGDYVYRGRQYDSPRLFAASDDYEW